MKRREFLKGLAAAPAVAVAGWPKKEIPKLTDGDVISADYLNDVAEAAQGWKPMWPGLDKLYSVKRYRYKPIQSKEVLR